MKFYITAALLVLSTCVLAQKKRLDHTVYNEWKSLKSHQISNDGRYVSYEINPHRGDGYLYLYDVETERLDSFPRAKKASFSGNNDYFAYMVTPHYDTLRQKELDDVDKKKWPKDTLVILMLETRTEQRFDKVKSFEVS